MLATAHGDLAGSSTAGITPWLVTIVKCLVPVFWMFFVGGVPTDFALASVEVSTGVQAQSSGLGGVDLKPPAAQMAPRTTSASARPPPMPACHCRRRRAAAARRAIWRSALARANARCRLLLEATGLLPSPSKTTCGTRQAPARVYG